MTSLDDLFNGPERPRDPEPRLPGRRWIAMITVATIALTGLTVVVLRIFRLSAPVLGIAGIALTLVLGWRAAWSLRPPPQSRHAWRRHHDERETGTDGLRQAISQWVTILELSQADPSRFNRKLLPRLGELTDERLRLKHGFTRASDPGRARAILGDPLWTFVTMPSRRPPHARELEQIVTALEKL